MKLNVKGLFYTTLAYQTAHERIMSSDESGYLTALVFMSSNSNETSRKIAIMYTIAVFLEN